MTVSSAPPPESEAAWSDALERSERQAADGQFVESRDVRRLLMERLARLIAREPASHA